MGVKISYNGNIISTMNSSGRRTALTSGKYMTGNIVVDYEDTSGGGSDIPSPTPTPSIDKPQANYSGAMVADGLGAFAVQLGWRPSSVTLKMVWNGIENTPTTNITFTGLADAAAGSFRGIWLGSTNVYNSYDALMAANNMFLGACGVYFIIVLTESGFTGQAGYTNTDGTYKGTLQKGDPVEWTATVNTNQQREIPTISAEFIRANGNRLRTADGKAWVCRGANLRLCDLYGNFDSDGYANRATTELTTSVYTELAGLGFNTAKLLFDYRFFERDVAQGTYNSSAFEWIRQQVTWAKAAGIKIMLNAHITQGGTHYDSRPEYWALEYWTNPQNQTRLVNLWRRIAQEFADEPGIIGYGVLNETHIDDADRGVVAQLHWEHCRVIQRIVDAIREVDSNHVVFVDAALGAYRVKSGVTYTGDIDRYYWQTAMIQDYNLCMEWHDYQPSAFLTRYEGASGSALQYPGTLFGGSSTATSATWQKSYQQAVNSRITAIYRQEMPIFAGEFGGSVLKIADTDATVRSQTVLCFTDKIAAFNANGMGYSWHQWKGADWGYYAVGSTAAYGSKRDYLTSVFQTGNAGTQSEGTKEDTPSNPSPTPESGGNSPELAISGNVIYAKSNYQPRAVITFIDDDGYATGEERFVNVLKSRGLRGCLAIVTGEVGKTARYTLEQLRGFQNDGFDILNHSVAHKNYTTLSDAEIRADIENAKIWCDQNGFEGDIFVWPYANPHQDNPAYTKMRDIARSVVKFGIGSGGGTIGEMPLDSIALTRFFATGNESDYTTYPDNIGYVESWINQAISTNGWLIIGSHTAYQISKKHMEAVANKVAGLVNQGKVVVRTVTEELAYRHNLYEYGDYYASDRLFIGADGILYGQAIIGVKPS